MKKRAQNFDVIIVGAGPAGCCAAITLAQGGKNVCLIEKASHPREKVCGDAISAKSYSVLRKLNLLDAFESVPKKEIGGALFSAPNQKEVTLRFNENSAGKKIQGAVLPRKILDNFLFQQAQKAGVTTLENHEFLSLSYSSKNILQGINIRSEEKFTLTSPVIIGADGFTSKVSHALGNPKPKTKTTLISGRSYISGVAGLTDQIEIHFLPEVYPGYFWIFPISDTEANVGLGISRNLLQKSGRTLPELFETALTSPKVADRFTNRTDTTPFRAWNIPTQYRKRNIVESDGVYLIGDAAGIVDIFTGEGVGNAMKSGHILGQVLLQSQPEGSYSKVLQEEISTELKMSRLVYTITRKLPWFFNGVVTLCEKSPRLLQWLVDVAMDDNRRKELLNPINYLQRMFK